MRPAEPSPRAGGGAGPSTPRESVLARRLREGSQGPHGLEASPHGSTDGARPPDPGPAVHTPSEPAPAGSALLRFCAQGPPAAVSLWLLAGLAVLAIKGVAPVASASRAVVGGAWAGWPGTVGLAVVWLAVAQAALVGVHRTTASGWAALLAGVLCLSQELPAGLPSSALGPRVMDPDALLLGLASLGVLLGGSAARRAGLAGAGLWSLAGALAAASAGALPLPAAGVLQGLRVGLLLTLTWPAGLGMAAVLCRVRRAESRAVLALLLLGAVLLDRWVLLTPP
jgi:hypothetical protein